MAASVNINCTKLWKEINSLQQDVLEGLGILKDRRQLIDKHCAECEKLFKPWPVKVSQLYGCVTEASEEIMQEPEMNPKSDQEDEKEKQELAMLDDILAKAQQARTVETNSSKKVKRPNSSKRPGVVSGIKTSQKASSTVEDVKSKPKVTYPILSKRPTSAKSIYSASYKIPKTKQAGLKKTTLSSNSAHQPPKTNTTASNPTQTQPEKPTHSQIDTLKNSPGRPASASGLKKSNAIESSKLQSTKTLACEPKFLLTEKGSLLIVPEKFQKLCKNHRKLIKRLEEIKGKNIMCSEEEDSFIVKITEHFSSNLSKLSGRNIYKECDILENKYQKLLMLAKDTVLTFQSIAEDTELETMAKAVEQWEYVILKQKELADEFHALKKDLEQVQRYCPCSDYQPQNFKDITGMKKCKSPITSTISNIANKDDLYYPTKNGYISYFNPQELKELQSLTHEYEMKKFQLELKRNVGEKILPLLKELPSDHRYFVPLFRSLYSILCCNSRTFPTMVLDSFTINEPAPS